MMRFHGAFFNRWHPASSAAVFSVDWDVVCHFDPAGLSLLVPDLHPPLGHCRSYQLHEWIILGTAHFLRPHPKGFAHPSDSSASPNEMKTFPSILQQPDSVSGREFDTQAVWRVHERVAHPDDAGAQHMHVPCQSGELLV